MSEVVQEIEEAEIKIDNSKAAVFGIRQDGAKDETDYVPEVKFGYNKVIKDPKNAPRSVEGTIRDPGCFADSETSDSSSLPVNSVAHPNNTVNNTVLAFDPDLLEDPSYLRDTRCGLGPFRPAWLQRLASKKAYVLVYGLIGMTEFGLGSYFVGTISTMEKRFKIPSWTSGLVSSGIDVGAVSCSLLISYVGGRSHKTRWVSVGTLFVSLSCFIQLIPHFMYGPGQDALELTREYGESLNITTPADGVRGPLCSLPSLDEEDCSESDTGNIAAITLFIGQVVRGVGVSMYYTLGISYMDDNARKNKTPLMLAVWQCLRMLGPTIGFIFASYALRMYVDPNLHPTITDDDPRWIGAWWFGWAPFGVMNIILAVSLAMFPKVLPRAAQRAAVEGKKKPITQRQISFKDFRETIGRLLKNRILVLNSMSSVCFMFVFSGYWIFMPKYMETQFRQTASNASLITGSMGLLFSALGVIVSASVISKFKPQARYVAGWNVFVELLDVFARIGYAFIGCPVADLHGTMGPDERWNLITGCNEGCECGPSVKYSPVCSSDKLTTFYSACHAGCSTQSVVNGSKIFEDCVCVGGNSSSSGHYVTDGACPIDCTNNFMIFLIIECLIRFLSATGRAGNTIIQFRCVDPEDKSVSIGFSEALLCGLAFIPGPIVYGMILDYSCLVWGETCGQTGNCWLYDGRSLRYLLNFPAAAFLFCGTLLDIAVWHNVKGLQIYDDDKDGADANRLADEGIERPLL